MSKEIINKCPIGQIGDDLQDKCYFCILSNRKAAKEEMIKKGGFNRSEVCICPTGVENEEDYDSLIEIYLKRQDAAGKKPEIRGFQEEIKTGKLTLEK